MADKSTVLIIDDDAAARAALEMLLEPEGYVLAFANNGQAGLEQAEALRPDVILLDAMMPDMHGFDVCQKLRANPLLADIPILMVTALDGREARLRGIEAGADDIIGKPYDRVELRARIRTITRLNRYRRLLETSEQLNRLANFDPLTNLPNRTLLHERLSQRCLLAKRQEQHFALLYLDLGGLKQINENFGQKQGDMVLQQVVRRLQQCIEGGDTLARVVGNEFAILHQPEQVVDEEAIANYAQGLLEAVTLPIYINEHELALTAHIGIAFYPNDALNPDELLKHADTAKSRAKLQTRQAYQFFTPQMNTVAMYRLVMQGELRKALEQGELMLYYQPLIDLTHNQYPLVGLEALVRWRHPNRGVLLPKDFIQNAEQNNLILPLGEWVLREACRQGQQWRQQQTDCPLRLSVNTSSLQFYQPQWLTIVARILEETGFPPACLELEITESLYIQDDLHSDADIPGILAGLRSLGIRLAIDDFGTGYSSLSYLRRFPVDTLKIDQSFVADVAEDPGDAALVTAIIVMAHSLNLTVIAEGIENAAQRDFLIQQHCDLGQGYLFNQPQPASYWDQFFVNNPR
jgi:diguanylate cyclase